MLTFGVKDSDTSVPANSVNDVQVTRCKYWNNGACNKGDACSFIHSEFGIPPISTESLVSIPALTSHTTDSNEVREIVAPNAQTAQSEIHELDRFPNLEGVKHADDSQVSLENSSLHSFPKLILLPLESDFNISIHTLPASSAEGCIMKTPQAEGRTADPCVEPVFSSHGIHEEPQKEALPEEGTREAPISFPSNVSSKEYEEDKITLADGELEGWYHSSSEG
jgi:Zinc finger C-x8-C-x5-C-x3-H type (and similar)